MERGDVEGRCAGHWLALMKLRLPLNLTFDMTRDYVDGFSRDAASSFSRCLTTLSAQFCSFTSL